MKCHDLLIDAMVELMLSNWVVTTGNVWHSKCSEHLAVPSSLEGVEVSALDSSVTFRHKKHRIQDTKLDLPP